MIIAKTRADVYKRQGKLIAEAFVNFVETEQEPLISFDDVLEAVHKPCLLYTSHFNCMW